MEILLHSETLADIHEEPVYLVGWAVGCWVGRVRQLHHVIEQLLRIYLEEFLVI